MNHWLMKLEPENRRRHTVDTKCGRERKALNDPRLEDLPVAHKGNRRLAMPLTMTHWDRIPGLE